MKHLLVLVAQLLVILIYRRSPTATSVNGYEIQKLISVQGIPVHRVPLRFHDPTAPYTLAVSTSIDMERNDKHDTIPYNFLASQVWPSARTAAMVIEAYMSNQKLSNRMVLCEFGCGPGLPSLTAALCHPNCQVIATDIDPLALELVRRAAIEQNITSRVETRVFDLTVQHVGTSSIPEADLYIFSDVFENRMVAKGAAHITARLLRENDTSMVWVFAQSDRAQREIYLAELQHLLPAPTLTWSLSMQPPGDVIHGAKHELKDRLWLCDINETNVFYG